MKSLKILQISDTHLSQSRPEYIENWHICAAVIAERAPDLVINSGDITLNGAEDDNELVLARQLHDALPAEWHVLAGNHDVGDSPGTGFANPPKPIVDRERLDRFERHFGRDHWLLDKGGWRLIGLNAQLWRSGLEAEAAQEAFLAEAVEAAAGRPVAVFIHQPLFNENAEEDSEPNRFPQNPERGRLLHAMAGGDVRLIASGHIHLWRDVILDGRRHVWAPSSAFIINAGIASDLGEKKHGLVELTLHEDGTSHALLIEPAGIVRHDIVAQVRAGALFPDSYSSTRLAADAR
jgi:3',5'-cyclic AMP phosphodiesterase CpdA